MPYPINLNLIGKKCLVIGGGSVAERKTLSLIEAKAEVTLISPIITEKLKDLVNENKLTYIEDTYKSGMVDGYFLLIAATNDEAANKLAIKEAKELKILVNAPANPELSDFTVPAVIKRGDLTVAVSTEGISPAFSRTIKEEISEFLPKNIEAWLNILKKIRLEIKEKFKTSKEREEFWRIALNKRIFELLKKGKLKEAEAELKNGFSGNGIKP